MLFRSVLKDAGFAVAQFEEVSAGALAWYEHIAPEGKGAKEGPSPLNVSVIVDREAGKKSRNLRENIARGRIRIYRGVFGRE